MQYTWLVRRSPVGKHWCLYADGSETPYHINIERWRSRLGPYRLLVASLDPHGVALDMGWYRSLKDAKAAGQRLVRP